MFKQPLTYQLFAVFLFCYILIKKGTNDLECLCYDFSWPLLQQGVVVLSDQSLGQSQACGDSPIIFGTVCSNSEKTFL